MWLLCGSGWSWLYQQMCGVCVCVCSSTSSTVWVSLISKSVNVSEKININVASERSCTLSRGPMDLEFSSNEVRRQHTTIGTAFKDVDLLLCNTFCSRAGTRLDRPHVKIIWLVYRRKATVRLFGMMVCIDLGFVAVWTTVSAIGGWAHQEISRQR